MGRVTESAKDTKRHAAKSKEWHKVRQAKVEAVERHADKARPPTSFSSAMQGLTRMRANIASVMTICARAYCVQIDAEEKALLPDLEAGVMPEDLGGGKEEADADEDDPPMLQQVVFEASLVSFKTSVLRSFYFSGTSCTAVFGVALRNWSPAMSLLDYTPGLQEPHTSGIAGGQLRPQPP